jgi:hypothetical protein
MGVRSKVLLAIWPRFVNVGVVRAGGMRTQFDLPNEFIDALVRRPSGNTDPPELRKWEILGKNRRKT